MLEQSRTIKSVRILILFTILFSLILNVNSQYTLTDDDVVVVDGYIDSCVIDLIQQDLIIPDSLDNQLLVGISNKVVGEGVFEGRNIFGVQFPPAMKEIGNYAFYWNFMLDSISLPDSLTRIGGRSFSFTNIDSVVIPPKVTYIAFQAFLGSAIRNLYIPNSVDTIEYNAFYGNDLRTVTFGDNANLRYLEGGIFSDNDLLSPVQLPINRNEGFIDWSDYEGKSYGKNGFIDNHLTTYTAMFPYTLQDDDVEVENGVITSYNNDGELKNLIIPDTLDGFAVEKIDYAVFKSARIRSIDFPTTIQSIGIAAFESCYIKNLLIPKEIDSIGGNAFQRNGMHSLTIPDTCQLSYIGGGAFSYMNNIDSIQLPFVDRLGYMFHGWTDSEQTEYEAGDSTSKLYLTYFANLTANINKLSFNANGGSGSMENIFASTDSSFVLPANGFTRSQYKFLGWSDTESGLVKYADTTTYKMNADTAQILYAVWTNKYDILFTSGSGGNITGDTIQLVEYGQNSTTVEAVPNNGYEFIEWQNSEGASISSDNPITVENISSDSTLIAVFGEINAIPGALLVDFNVFPNPTKGELKITVENIKYINIYNFQGQLIESLPYDKASGRIDLKQFSGNTFFFRAIGSNGNTKTIQVTKN